ncbi:SRPBCC family protein [Tsuneonella sp. HG249]
MDRVWVLGLATLALAQPACAEVVESSADHFVTRDSATVKSAPRATWLALIEPAQWWNKAHSWSGDAANLTITPQAGGCFCERIPEKDGAAEVGLAGSAQHMTVVMAEPMKVLRMRGGLGPLQSEPVDGVLTITMQPDKASGGTKLTWEYIVAGHMRFEVAKISKAVDGVMSEQLGRLADKLGTVSAAATAPAAKPADRPTDEPAGDDVGAALDKMDD